MSQRRWGSVGDACRVLIAGRQKCGADAMADISRSDRDELSLVLFSRLLSRRPVWVDSPVGQITWVSMIALDDDGEVIVYDKDGNDRRCEDYLLSSPGRSES
jgi:hypothetical protein